MSSSTASWWTVFIVCMTTGEFVWADGPFALVSGRRDPSAIVIDLGKTPRLKGLCALEGDLPSPADHQLSDSYQHLRASYAPVPRSR